MKIRPSDVDAFEATGALIILERVPDDRHLKILLEFFDSKKSRDATFDSIEGTHGNLVRVVKVDFTEEKMLKGLNPVQ